ncbi:MAG: cobyrinate a,c-diamide synthase, partial [Niameybacter sp.]
MKTIPRLMLAGTASGTGKTTITCAILKHFHNQNKKVVAFKCGPDYIDTMFHKEVLKTPSYNLDLFMMGKEVCNHLLVKHAKDADFSLIEGVMGFYDGISDTTEASSYALAFETKTPVVLVVSCKGMGLSIVPLLQGYLNYKKNSIKGVILNDISQMTYDYYKKMIEAQTNLRVYGFMPHIEACRLESRHLGLITAKEVEAIESKIEKLGEEAAKSIDFEGLVQLAESSEPLEVKDIPELNGYKKPQDKVRIGIAQDKAFSFYYADNIEVLEELGAELIPFSPLEDKTLPVGIQGIILGGGYPEVYAKALSENETMKVAIKMALEAGMPCIAECGGFMYLQESIKLLDGKKYPMVGYLEGKAFMTEKLMRFGYLTLTSEEDTMLTAKGQVVKAHEFHYSDSTHNGNACVGSKPYKDKKWSCMVAKEHLFAGYPHIHFYNNISLATNFIEKCSKHMALAPIVHVLPNEIEKESFRMIDEILGDT